VLSQQVFAPLPVGDPAELLVGHGQVALPVGVARVRGGQALGNREGLPVVRERAREVALGMRVSSVNTLLASPRASIAAKEEAKSSMRASWKTSLQPASCCSSQARSSPWPVHACRARRGWVSLSRCTCGR